MAITSSYDCQSHRFALHRASMLSNGIRNVFSMRACNICKAGDQQLATNMTIGMDDNAVANLYPSFRFAGSCR